MISLDVYHVGLVTSQLLRLHSLPSVFITELFMKCASTFTMQNFVIDGKYLTVDALSLANFKR